MHPRLAVLLAIFAVTHGCRCSKEEQARRDLSKEKAKFEAEARPSASVPPMRCFGDGGLPVECY
jgi:hypothetical protein